MNRFATACTAMIVVASLAPMAHAQTMEAKMAQMMPTTLSLTAQADLRAVPDMATINAGVMTQAPTAKAAMDDNAQKMTQVMAALKAAGIAERDIQTSGLSLQPQYVYVENKPPVLSGYQVTNMLDIRVRKLTQLGGTLDVLVARGVNQINGPTFLIEKADDALDAARADAVAKAMKRAELYARAAGLKVKRVLSITEGGGYAPPPMPMIQMKAMAMADSAPTPIAPGQVAMSATVSVMFELEK